MLYGLHKAIKLTESIAFIRVANLCRFQRAPQNLYGSVVRFERNGKGMSVTSDEITSPPRD
jgi:hypothetical protein